MRASFSANKRDDGAVHLPDPAVIPWVTRLGEAVPDGEVGARCLEG
jgi:hypothetical protein